MLSDLEEDDGVEFVGDFDHNGMNRRYIYVKGEIPNALAVLLHPFGGSAQSIYANEGVSLLSNGFSLLLPQGYHNSWNAQFCCGEAKELQLDDVDFITKLSKKIIQERFTVPTENVIVYLYGFSNGAFLTSQLALNYLVNSSPNHLALNGIAMVSGYSYDFQLYKSAIRTGKHLPVLALHGMNDAHVNIHGCCAAVSDCCCGITSQTCLSFQTSVQHWKRINSCSPNLVGEQEEELQEEWLAPSLSFVNLTSEPNNVQCLELPTCQVYSCEFTKERHFIFQTENIGLIVAKFFLLQHQRVGSSLVILDNSNQDGEYSGLLLLVILISITALLSLFVYTWWKMGREEVKYSQVKSSEVEDEEDQDEQVEHQQIELVATASHQEDETAKQQQPPPPPPPLLELMPVKGNSWPVDI